MGRFQREAQVLASLSHPNIGAIHGIEDAGDTKALVLELIEGLTLADRIAKGAIPVEEALKIALQIAEGLEAAHEKGVIHRDLKPANIKITPDGQVKILDFGLAKAMEGDPVPPDISQSPTLSMQATQAGGILGTATYMSPEQARGETADTRADVWAFGCVLFEMLTGQPVFDGGTVSDVLASVLRAEPKWDELPGNLHPRLSLLLERCLEKKARDRYHGISDARVDIRKIRDDPKRLSESAPNRDNTPLTFPLLLGAMVFSGVLAGVAVWTLRPSPQTETKNPVRFTIPLSSGDRLAARRFSCGGPFPRRHLSRLRGKPTTLPAVNG